MSSEEKFRKLRPTTQKIIILLVGGINLALNSSPRRHFQIIKSIKKNWDWIDHHNLHRNIKSLYRSHLIDEKDNDDGTITIVLTELGKKHALTYQIDEIKVPAMKWDKKWRIVMFDIPEKRKRARDALSKTLKNMEFVQLQKSVFVHPFECSKEVSFVTEFFKVRPYIRLVLAENIDSEYALKKKFNLK